MTKLKLKFAGSEEMLSRAEMKQVFGGYMSGSDDTEGGCYWYRCVCSEPTSSIVTGSTWNVIIKAESAEKYKEEVQTACTGYGRADCTKDKPC